LTCCEKGVAPFGQVDGQSLPLADSKIEPYKVHK